MKLKNNKDDVELLHAKAELIDEHCHLQHNEELDPAKDHEAVEYLVQYLGVTKDDVEEAQDMLMIPICQDCVDGLSDPKWFLMYCITCNNSQWIYRPLWHPARKPLPKYQVQWVDECHHCKDTGQY